MKVRTTESPSPCLEVASEVATIPLEVADLRLGMSEEVFMALVGGTTRLKNGWREAFFHRAIGNVDDGVEPEYIPHINVEVSGKFSEGRLVHLRIGKWETDGDVSKLR
jgi:hypothetical protein